MAARILSGKTIADAIKAEVAEESAGLGFKACLVVVRVGEDPASEVYVSSKVRTAAELGIISREEHLADDITQADLLDVVTRLNNDRDVDGILVQLPIPKAIDEKLVIEAIDPEKDVDGFHPLNVGRLSLGHASLVPCTPAGVIEILKRSDIPINGRHAVIVGRSNIVGKPLAMLLLKENATVTVCHSRTNDLASITRQADILIAAIGRPGFIGEEHIGEGATVIDVGINRLTDRAEAARFFEGEELVKRLKAIETRGSTLVGDVDPKAAMVKAANFTPVPGGVGLLTVAMLMKNTITAARLRRKL
jgi:methylenetetrahydrofolate dehydrogenase (NADP+)/methenyltetrahydrofolate cyclohydrolase